MYIFSTKLRQFGKCSQYFPTICRNRNYSQDSVELSSKVNFANLHHRKIISVQGKDAASFLQGMITNDVTLLSEMKSMYAMILNQHGRVVHDVILYHPKSGDPDEILMECEKESLPAIAKTLKLYKLKKKFTVTPREDIAIVQAFCDAQLDSKDFGFGDIVTSCVDPRVPDFGLRILVENLRRGDANLGSSIGDYHRKRYEMGIPEGPSDLPSGNCLPLECNLDYMNGVSFHKGCYIGQELTARTKFTGVIRKRLLPVSKVGKGQIEPGETIYNGKGKSAGKFRFLHSDGDVGLALVRLNYLEETLRTKNGEIELTCHIPTWWPFKNGTEFSDGVCGPSIDIDEDN